MRSLSSNLLKRGYANLKQDDARIIDVNELMEKRMEELAARMQQQEEEDGFKSGLVAESIEGDSFSENGEGVQGNVIKAGLDNEQLREEAKKEAEEILEQARAQAEEIEKIAESQARMEKERMLEQARQQGYAEGLEKAEKENAHAEAEFRERRKQLEAEYQSMVDELEPRFVEAITGIYEHIFHVELSSYHDVLCHLIATTLHKTDGTNDFLIHVSKEDYPYVSMQKKQLASGVTAPNSTVEIIEDITLSENECLIETAGGIFDCGLGTQLTELRQKLKLLSYEK